MEKDPTSDRDQTRVPGIMLQRTSPLTHVTAYFNVLKCWRYYGIALVEGGPVHKALHEMFWTISSKSSLP